MASAGNCHASIYGGVRAASIGAGLVRSQAVTQARRMREATSGKATASEAERDAGGDLQIVSGTAQAAEANDRITHVKSQCDMPRRI